jgi:hypothetical protein
MFDVTMIDNFWNPSQPVDDVDFGVQYSQRHSLINHCDKTYHSS